MSATNTSGGTAAGTIKSVAIGVIVIALIFVGREMIGAALNARADAPEKVDAPPVMAKLTPAQTRRFVELARTQGTLLARDYALVSARKEGLIVELPVREGDLVRKGETVLFKMDAVSFEQTVEADRRSLDVARFTLAEKEANLKKDKADLVKEEKDWARYQELFASKSISESQLDSYRANYHKAIAQVEYAESLVELAKSQIKVAEANLVIAEKELADTVVKSPLDGFVTHRALEPGQNASPGQTVVRVDDISLLEATGFLAGRHYARVVAENQRTTVAGLALASPEHAAKLPDPDSIPISQVSLVVEDGQPLTLPLTYKSPAVDQSLRTFKIKANVKGDGQRLVPGLLVDMGVQLRTETGIGVPKTAVTERGGKPCVFVVEGGKAKMLTVELGIESDNWYQVLSGNIPVGTPVVDGGAALAQIDENTPITVTQGANGNGNGNGNGQKTAAPAPDATPAPAQAPAAPAAGGVEAAKP